jgi:hypothetical protein
MGTSGQADDDTIVFGHTWKRPTMNKLVWQTGEPPKDRRVLVIGIPKDTGPQIHQEPEMTIGHWHHQHEDFVCAALAADLRKGVPPKFQVIYWAEIEPPPDIKLRPLTKRDTHA